VSLDGTPSIGTVSTSEHSVEWKIVPSGRGLTGKSIEVTFPGTVKFAPWKNQMVSSSRSLFGTIVDEDSDNEAENASNMINEEHLMEKMNKDLPPVDLEEPFCWQAYNYAKVHAFPFLYCLLIFYEVCISLLTEICLIIIFLFYISFLY
jgi:AP-5 complex subunit mu-1